MQLLPLVTIRPVYEQSLQVVYYSWAKSRAAARCVFHLFTNRWGWHVAFPLWFMGNIKGLLSDETLMGKVCCRGTVANEINGKVFSYWMFANLTDGFFPIKNLTEILLCRSFVRKGLKFLWDRDICGFNGRYFFLKGYRVLIIQYTERYRKKKWKNKLCPQ